MTNPMHPWLKEEGPVDTVSKPSGVSRATFMISWADAKWLDEDEKTKIRAATPPHLRATVESGVPMLGAGSIYPIPLDELLVDDFVVPVQYKRIYGMDVGWNRTAAVFLAHDLDNDMVYVTGEHYVGQQVPEVHAAAIKRIASDWMAGVIDPASNGRSQQDGTQLIKIYRQLGLKLREADNSVEAGIQAVNSRLAAGKLKFMRRATPNLQTEYSLYRRKDNGTGSIVKKDDHAMDGLRYGVMGLPMAVYPGSNDPLRSIKLTIPNSGKRYDL